MSRIRCAAFAAAVIACAAGGAGAQQYPTKPIRLIVAFPPGGSTDIIARVIGQKLGERLGQQVVIDNRGGAGGTIGTELTAKAPADGYTMLINNISLAVNATLYPKLPYDTLKDLAPVTLAGRQPNLLVAHPTFPVKSVRDLVALAKAKPRAVNYGSGGVGTAGHLATELFMMMTGVQLVHIPYKGLGPALTDLMGGHVQLAISTLASALPQVKAGKMRALAVTTARRSSFFPEIPTMSESGVAGYEFSTWYALLVPAGTPRGIVDRLNAECTKALDLPALKEQFSAQGLEPASSTSEELAAYLTSEIAKWAKVVKQSGAKPE
jgi:tripartite-type tricarboxylate transporter receptor subunit TctC